MLKRDWCLQNWVSCCLPLLDVLSCFSCVFACMHLDSFDVPKALRQRREHILECMDESSRCEGSGSEHGVSGVGVLEIIRAWYVIDDEVDVCQIFNEASTDGPLLTVFASS